MLFKPSNTVVVAFSVYEYCINTYFQKKECSCTRTRKHTHLFVGAATKLIILRRLLGISFVFTEAVELGVEYGEFLFLFLKASIAIWK